MFGHFRLNSLFLSFLFGYSEITFENAEELTEENKAFVLLFHSPNDTKSIKNYHTNVAAELEGDRGTNQLYLNMI